MYWLVDKQDEASASTTKREAKERARMPAVIPMYDRSTNATLIFRTGSAIGVAQRARVEEHNESKDVPVNAEQSR